MYYSYVIKFTVATLALKHQSDDWLCTKEHEIERDSQASKSAITRSAPLEAIARLQENVTFVPDYNSALKIMFLGDSLTYGVKGINDRDSGGYRPELWKKFEADALPVQFVGSVLSGPKELGDKNHEGHPGWTIKQISTHIERWLVAAQPDLILLMIGTNDTGRSSLKTMIEDLNTLIDQITNRCPKTQLLVASIPPIHPLAKPMIRSIRAMYFNAAIPSILDAKRVQGKNVSFVDMKSLTIEDLTAAKSFALDKGLHPNTEGYRKIANHWHDAVFNVISNRLTISTTTY